jgi:hypothetical protein
VTASPPPFYDPRTGGWTFDTNTILSLEAGSLLGAIAMNMRSRVHLLADVVGEARTSAVLASTSLGSRLSWYSEERLTLPAHQTLYTRLRQSWGSAPGKDGGEAACITLAAAYDWSFVCDDRVGFTTASLPPASLCTMRTTSLVIAMVRSGWLSKVDAWAAIQAMLTAGRWLGPSPWIGHADFDHVCDVASFASCRHTSGAL